ncbi:MAG: hypothetical protein R3B07_31035 [Polyangiaceae bacterium]
MSAPLPAEAIGVGAKWVVNTSVVQQGLPLTQIAIELSVSLEETSGEPRSRCVSSPPKGEIKLPDCPSRGQDGAGQDDLQERGETYFDLENPVPKVAPKKTSTKISEDHHGKAEVSPLPYGSSRCCASGPRASSS